VFQSLDFAQQGLTGRVYLVPAPQLAEMIQAVSATRNVAIMVVVYDVSTQLVCNQFVLFFSRLYETWIKQIPKVNFFEV
jgi:hypothetical protein